MQKNLDHFYAAAPGNFSVYLWDQSGKRSVVRSPHSKRWPWVYTPALAGAIALATAVEAVYPRDRCARPEQARAKPDPLTLLTLHVLHMQISFLRCSVFWGSVPDSAAPTLSLYPIDLDVPTTIPSGNYTVQTIYR